MATAEERKFQAVAERYSKQRGDLLARLLAYLFSVRGKQPHRYRDWELGLATVAQTLTVLEVYAAEQRKLTRSFATQVLRDMNAMPATLPPVAAVYPRSGVTAVEVYKRPIETWWFEKSKGATDEAADRAADARFEEIVTEDMALVARDESQRTYAASKKVIGRRRIIHPERSKTGTCGLCIAAATRMYYVDDLMPLHDGCNCDDVPVTVGNDPGLTLNEADLKALYAAAGSTAAEDLKRIRATVNEHGELGPILTREGDAFRDAVATQALTGRKKVTPWAKPTKDDQRASWAAIRASSERAVERLRAAQAGGSNEVTFDGKYSRPVTVPDIAQAIGFHQDLIDRYSALLK